MNLDNKTYFFFWKKKGKTWFNDRLTLSANSSWLAHSAATAEQHRIKAYELFNCFTSKLRFICTFLGVTLI